MSAAAAAESESESEVLAYRFARHLNEASCARADAAALLSFPDPIALASRDPIALASRDPIALASHDPIALASHDPIALASHDPIAVRMRRQREADDAMWRRVHEAAQALFADLTAAQRRVAQQESEIARVAAEIEASKSAVKNAEIARDAQTDRVAAAITHQQLQLLRMRGDDHGDGAVLTELQYRRHRASAERRAEEELLHIYGSALRRHIAEFPLSPLREELRRTDAEMWLFVQK